MEFIPRLDANESIGWVSSVIVRSMESRDVIYVERTNIWMLLVHTFLGCLIIVSWP